MVKRHGDKDTMGPSNFDQDRQEEVVYVLSHDGKYETDTIKNQFMELVFEEHKNVACVQMIKRDTGIVFLKPDMRVKSYCLSFGIDGFELLEIIPPPDSSCSPKK